MADWKAKNWAWLMAVDLAVQLAVMMDSVMVFLSVDWTADS